MKTYQLEGTPRESVGKKATKALRKESLIPAVLYGQSPVELPFNGSLNKGENIVETKDKKKGIIITNFIVSADSVRKLIYTPDIFLVELTLNGKVTKVILKDIQFHPVSENILHIDFQEVFDEKPIVMEVPVVLEGYAEGVKSGGKLNLEMRRLRVKALYDKIPEKLTVNVDHLGLGKTIQVGELSFENLELVNAKNAVVCAVKLTRAARGAAAVNN
ncbi:MAG: 50S ribosomal protein L25/general stress protein Ctc [Tannerella sp.]|jgi:large subunit ribosomal protein L25|nr:50S ribosomal protein L25/general stress protein Ctc [Tannerella sp.]